MAFEHFLNPFERFRYIIVLFKYTTHGVITGYDTSNVSNTCLHGFNLFSYIHGFFFIIIIFFVDAPIIWRLHCTLCVKRSYTSD